MQSQSTLQLDFKNLQAKPPKCQSWAGCGFRIEQVTLETDEAYDFHAAGETHYLALHHLALVDGELKIDGLPRITRTELRGTLTFAPRGCTINGWSKPESRRNSYTAFYFDPERLRDDLGDRYARAEVQPFAYARDISLASTMSKLRDIVASSGSDELYAETLGLAAAIEVLGVPVSECAGRLGRVQIDRVYQYVSAHFHEAITLDDLANLTGLSRFHFSRAFKATTGVGPHRFVSNWRIARAREMLEGYPSLSIEAIACAVGFGSSNVFRRAFQQTVGRTPQQYRTGLN